MLVYPAIDLLDGRCVRLRQGRFDEATVHSEDPVSVARSFVEGGALGLHIVDLDGARLGKARNLDWIYRIREVVSVPLQVGGGIRTFALASRLLKAGVDRIVLGTAAAEDPRLLQKVLEGWDPDRVAAALDMRDGKLVVQGRESESARTVEQVLEKLRALNVRWLVCTDVTRDGILIGPNQELTTQMVAEGFRVVISGGVATLEDIERIRDAGAAGCIIGSAFYGGILTIAEANVAAGGV
ncbi:MAG: 1-(5-phosphoribosyl)-5-[(5-phosphoribosylamino)methylideneamino]imidazole-4-carboxamide isomerase [Gemmatimonadetes bacterium]|uniref:1-(5-phosphoribosyl)-5-[(5-phosphoribosylamino)methylideneamino] imidazole-4-carboxamide isomerase n=1 Tax=Candidatus Kutchimonas denitrificans TaxID=3056748 RepID=A0AAE4Z7M0_9BACT|nr:1-(5-phosphoribosyl)-5-[(5-phosphoribosylamino)methylideneamino]imidazole-4-carboxamide isomerase [Gemmatimonadota bacterium]NIR74488.1 1-(5-phosphoribosyl)-5-[(5-phosphoribosylamino)methylideneamino]imidazole-4-carboxamide isomerase [Candidatus Kutchimonas denitrificans]NIS02678.1 1-(5-phosphoribosyl)-5-[(5-phosphoribosylamino)methylideneamino]imidazole-4-carboxamide isomerase [Gemmatimonadota bacterium]NIT68839.1 1-(5-phosphoribosyl)-5-[(5-phosphoribosylamino)methylideneamino]imidazole-4-ca